MEPNYFSPVVISGKKAEEHLAKIKSEHGDILNSMAQQNLRVQQFSQQKDLERRDQQMRDTELNQKTLDRKDNNQNESNKMAIETKKLALQESEINQSIQ